MIFILICFLPLLLTTASQIPYCKRGLPPIQLPTLPTMKTIKNNIKDLKNSIKPLWTHPVTPRHEHKLDSLKTVFRLAPRVLPPQYYRHEHLSPNPNYSHPYPIIVHKTYGTTQKCIMKEEDTCRPCAVKKVLYGPIYGRPLCKDSLFSGKKFRIANTSVPSLWNDQFDWRKTWRQKAWRHVPYQYMKYPCLSRRVSYMTYPGRRQSSIYRSFQYRPSYYRPSKLSKPTGQVISSSQLDPSQFKGSNMTVYVSLPRVLRKRHPPSALGREKWPLLGRYEVLPKTFSKRWKFHGNQKRQLPRESLPWARQTPNQPAPAEVAVGPAPAVGPVWYQKKQAYNPVMSEVDFSRNNQMDIIRRISQLKAMGKIAEENRGSHLHNTQRAKRDFQERMGEQVNLLSEAKRADLRAREAFQKVVGLERGLSEQDRAIHRLKEEEDALYEELLESEVEVAKADMAVIPQMPSEEELQQFLTGSKYL